MPEGALFVIDAHPFSPVDQPYACTTLYVCTNWLVKNLHGSVS